MKIYKGEFDKKLELQIAPAIMAGFPSPAEEYFSESDAFDDAFDTFQAPLPALYQSGYLTIKDYSQEDDLTMLVVQYHKHD